VPVVWSNMDVAALAHNVTKENKITNAKMDEMMVMIKQFLVQGTAREAVRDAADTRVVDVVAIAKDHSCIFAAAACCPVLWRPTRQGPKPALRSLKKRPPLLGLKSYGKPKSWRMQIRKDFPPLSRRKLRRILPADRRPTEHFQLGGPLRACHVWTCTPDAGHTRDRGQTRWHGQHHEYCS
jgi:hypothetical protein